MSYKITQIEKYYKVNQQKRDYSEDIKNLITKSGEQITTKDGKKIIYL
jgi:hypothetical protein